MARALLIACGGFSGPVGLGGTACFSIIVEGLTGLDGLSIIRVLAYVAASAPSYFSGLGTASTASSILSYCEPARLTSYG